MNDRTGDTKEVTTNIDTLSYGRYLRAKRFEKGVSLEEISRETKIGIDFLLLIEKEDHERLPAEVYVKGFLRAYAKAIDADGDKVVENYTKSLSVFQAVTRSEEDLKKSDKAFWPRLLLLLGTLVCVMAVSVYLLSFLRDRSVVNDSPIQTRPQEAEAESDTEPSQPRESLEPVRLPEGKNDGFQAQTIQAESAIKENNETEPEKYLLKINAIEETWIKAIVDNEDPIITTLYAGDHLELEASSGYNLLIGNAGGVTLTLNGKPFKIHGKRGQVVNLQFPR